MSLAMGTQASVREVEGQASGVLVSCLSAMTRYLLAIDQGTTGSTALVMATDGKTLGRCTVEFPQHYPQPAWVEHDPVEIQTSVTESTLGALAAAGLGGDRIAAVGITNQRETTLVWDRASGRPVGRAIVWQDRRTASQCQRLEALGHGAEIRARTGLVLDPYFSATKIAWLLDAEPGLRARADAGELAFGTVDSFLLWWLCGGAKAGASHQIDLSSLSQAQNAKQPAISQTAAATYIVMSLISFLLLQTTHRQSDNPAHGRHDIARPCLSKFARVSSGQIFCGASLLRA